MKTIPSFTIDHIRLLRGIYVSRKDQVGNEVVTTFDIRMKEPNREPALGQGALHTIEHLAATYLRNRINGSTASYYREDGDEHYIKVRYAPEFRTDIEDIENILIYSNNGSAVRIKDVGTVVDYGERGCLCTDLKICKAHLIRCGERELV